MAQFYQLAGDVREWIRARRADDGDSLNFAKLIDNHSHLGYNPPPAARPRR
ncbi:MAG: hypothetical protein ACR2P7_08930 [bacterium]